MCQQGEAEISDYRRREEQMEKVKEPKIPERELQKAFDFGVEAARAGKPQTACPFALVVMRARWLAGWDAGQY